MSASPASCASISPICCYYKQLCPCKSFDLRALLIIIMHAVQGYRRHMVKLARFIAMNLRFYNGYKHGSIPTMRWILGLKLKRLWSEIGEQNMRTECQICAVWIDGKSLLYQQCYNAYYAVFAPAFSFKLAYFLVKISTLLLLFVPSL